MVMVWSGLLRTRSPWLMSLVQVAPLLALPAKGLLSLAALRRPRTAQAGGRERAEVAPVRAHRLDDHQVLVLALDLVDLDRLEQVGRRVAHDRRVVRAEAAREVPDRHAGPVDVAVVAGEEQVHVRAVTDQRLVDRAGAGAGDAAGEQRLVRRTSRWGWWGRSTSGRRTASHPTGTPAPRCSSARSRTAWAPRCPELIPVWPAEAMSDQFVNGLNVIEPYDPIESTFDA